MSTNNGVRVDARKVVTGIKTRWSYAHLLEPHAIEEGQTPKYSLSLIIPKDDTKTIQKIKTAIQAAYKEGEGTLKGNGKTVPALNTLKQPLRDGDQERPDDEAYRNAYFLNASAATKPGIVDRNCNPILDPNEIYSGCYGPVSVNFYAFNKAGNKGIACGLNNVMKWSDGESLGGRATPDVDFAEFADMNEDSGDDSLDFLN